MLFNVSRVDTWKVSLADQPGALAGKLEGLARAEADLEMVVARRSQAHPGEGALYVSPLNGEAQTRAAAALGFERTHPMQTIRVEGPDEPGLAYLITRALAGIGLNLRGMSAARLGPRFIMFLTFDSPADADKAIERLNRPV